MPTSPQTRRQPEPAAFWRLGQSVKQEIGILIGPERWCASIDHMSSKIRGNTAIVTTTMGSFFPIKKGSYWIPGAYLPNSSMSECNVRVLWKKFWLEMVCQPMRALVQFDSIDKIMKNNGNFPCWGLKMNPEKPIETEQISHYLCTPSIPKRASCWVYYT